MFGEMSEIFDEIGIIVEEKEEYFDEFFDDVLVVVCLVSCILYDVKCLSVFDIYIDFEKNVFMRVRM